MRRFILVVLSAVFLLVGGNVLYGDDDVMMQGFYWDVPVDDVNFNGTWWTNLQSQAQDLADAGITAIWTPPPSKGHWGITDMGYGIFDHYDLGNYDQKGTTETRFGSRQELLDMVSAFHNNNVRVYCDIVLNHIYGGQLEGNPVVRDYTIDRPLGQSNRVNYSTSTRWWVLPDVQGDFWIQFLGHDLDFSPEGYQGRSYEARVYWLPVGEVIDPYNWPDPACPDPTWEYEPNNGGGQYNEVPGNGCAIWAHTDYENDIDEFHLYLGSAYTIWINITPKTYNPGTGEMEWASDNNDYRVQHLWAYGYDLVYDNPSGRRIELWTPTFFDYVNHTGAGEQNYDWHYGQFHPAYSGDYLEDGGVEDAVRPRWMLFGGDFDTYDATTVQPRLIQWGQWLTNTVGFDGYRLDFVRGFQEDFVAQWLNNMPQEGGQQRFAVGEYWTNYKYRLTDWLTAVGNAGATVSLFDFPLREKLKSMCDTDNGAYDMSDLRTGDYLSMTHPMQAVTFVDNHDTDKEDHALVNDKMLAYAFTLFSEGYPCVFYRDFSDDAECYGLGDEIIPLIQIRKKYLGGTTIRYDVPSPGIGEDLYIARRDGFGSLPGGILLLNDSYYNDLSHSVNVSGWSAVSPGDSLIDATGNIPGFYVIDGSGNVTLDVKKRRDSTGRVTGYAIYIPKPDDFYSLHLGLDNGSDVFPQETADYPYYTGAASALMSIKFLDDTYSQDQDYIYSTYLSGTSGEEMVALDIRNAMNAEAPAPYNYTVFNDDDEDLSIKRFIHWIDYEVPGVDEPNAPSMVPVYGDYNWIVVRGFVTDMDPCDMGDIWTIPDLTLYWMWINDPRAAGLGYNVYLSAAEFREIFDQVDGSFQSLCEPPEGSENDKRDDNFSTAKITYAELLPNNSLAANLNNDKFLNEYDWGKVIPKTLMQMAEFKKIFTVSHYAKVMETANLDAKENYSLIVFNANDWKEDMASLVLMLDTKTAAFKSASWTLKPQHYLPLSEKDAIEIAIKATAGKYKTLDNVRLAWSCEFNTSKLLPSYEVIFNNEYAKIAEAIVIFVHQDGSWDIGKPGLGKLIDESMSTNTPHDFKLYQNTPNPFNPTTRITYNLPSASHVELKVYDLLGHEISILINENQVAGKYTVVFDGKAFSSGVYFCHLKAGDNLIVKKMILMK